MQKKSEKLRSRTGKGWACRAGGRRRTNPNGCRHIARDNFVLKFSPSHHGIESTAGDLLAGHPRCEFPLGDVQRFMGAHAGKQIETAGDHPRPSGLMAGAEARAIVAVEVFVEQDVVIPVRVFLKRLRSAVNRAQSAGITEENARKPASNFLCDFEQGHEFSRTGGTFDLEVISVKLIKVHQTPNKQAIK